MPSLFDKRDDDEPDLDYGEDPTLELDYEAPLLFDRGTKELPPGSGRTDWAPIREALIRHRRAKGIGEDGRKVGRSRVESDEPAISIREAGHVIAIEKLPQSGRLVAQRAAAKGWQIRAVHSGTHYADVLYQSDSKTSDKVRGDVLYPAEDREHYTIHGRLSSLDQIVAAFRLSYQTRPAKTKSGIATAFNFANFYDVVTGANFTLEATQFTDWFDILVKPAKPRAQRKTLEEKRDAKIAAPIESGEWISQ